MRRFKISYWFIIFLGGYMLSAQAQANMVLISDPQIVNIPIIENHEPMIDLRQQKIISYGPSPEIQNNTDYTKMRKTVYEKLVKAQQLLPKNLHFCIYEAYRSLQLQNKLFEDRVAKIKKLHPDWSAEQRFHDANKMVAPVKHLDGTANTPPHSTGGAIDIYLLNEKNEPIPMGIHPKDWMQDNDASISTTNSKIISEEAQHNRKIMSKALATVGFVNYPTEYWHWSYGERYWAYHTGKSHAIYGGK
jgi:D-alanyl-D-alanine dipeptidase